jgi:RNA polymerase sigma-70 factor (ECF subfamily)
MHDDLLRRLRAGHDPETLARLFELDQAALYRFMLRQLGHRQDAEDATQELFRRVLASLGSLRDPAGYRGWLYRIALRVAQAQRQARLGERRRVHALLRSASGSGASPMDDFDDRRARIKSAVDSLDLELRTVVVLRYEQGLSYEEIAAATQRPVGTVSKRLHTAHQKLQQALAAVGASLAIAALSEALAATASETIPASLAARLRQMALEAPAGSSAAWTSKAAAAVGLSFLTILVVALPLIRKSSEDLSFDGRSQEFQERGRLRTGAAADARPPAPRKDLPDPAWAESPRALPGEALVRGRAVDRETRAPIVGAQVWLESETPAGGGVIARTTTASEGTFSLRAPPGTYRVDALAPGYVRFQMQRSIEVLLEESPAGGEIQGKKAAEGDRKAPKLELRAGSEIERTLELVPAAELRGLVVDRSQRPVPGAGVSFETQRIAFSISRGPGLLSEQVMQWTYEPDGKTLRFSTDLQGRFVIPHLYPNGDASLSVSCAGFESLTQSVPLGKGQAEITLVLDRGASYGGRVSAEEGQPLAGACVFLLGSPTGPISKALVTGSGGEFLGVDQHRGAKVMAVYAPGFGPRLVELLGQDPLGVRTTLPRAESAVAGLISDESGHPLDGVSVTVNKYELKSGETRVQMGFLDAKGSGFMETEADVISFFLPSSIRASGTSSQGDGSFRLDGVAGAGCNVHLEFRKEGFSPLVIPASASVPLRIQLRPKEN